VHAIQDLLRHHLASDLHVADRLGMNELVEMVIDHLEKQKAPHLFDRPGGGAGTPSEQHQAQQEELGNIRPGGVVGRCKTRRGHDRDHLKGTVAQGRGKIRIDPSPEDESHTDDDDQNAYGIEAKLGVSNDPEISPKGLEMEREIGAGQEHEEDENHVDGCTVVGTDARGLGRESSRGHGREGMQQGVDGRHPEQDEHEEFNTRQE